MLDAKAIIADAESLVGILDSDHDLKPNLEALVASLNMDAQLPVKGMTAAHDWLLRSTVNRLEGLKCIAANPRIAEERVVAPVFLTGLPRSGTTYFQYLFDRDARFRLIRTWESTQPNPPLAAEPEHISARKEEQDRERRAALGPVENFDALHLIDPNGPAECHDFMEQSYGAAGFHNLFRVPGYFDHMMDGLDFERAYRIHKRQLQLLQWRMGRPRWALKYPNHVIAMDAILKVYPDARFVMTHRDPVQTLASIAKMTLKLSEVRYDAPLDPHLVGEQMLYFIGRHIDRIMTFTDGPDADKVTHVDYYRLLDDPAAAMLDVHVGLGIDSPQAVRDAVAEWRTANPKNKRGANDYSLAQFGLDADAVSERFAPYMQRFGIPREIDGLARMAV